MNLPKLLGASCLASALVFSSSVFAQQPSGAQQPQGWMWGFGVVAAQDVYTDFDNRIVPIPIIGYASEKLRVYGPFVSYELFQESGFTLDAQLVPVFAGYEEDDSIVFLAWKTETSAMPLALDLTTIRAVGYIHFLPTLTF